MTGRRRIPKGRPSIRRIERAAPKVEVITPIPKAPLPSKAPKGRVAAKEHKVTAPFTEVTRKRYTPSAAESQAALAKLREYEVIERPPQEAGAGAKAAAREQLPGYDLASAIKAGISERTLLTAGFSSEIITNVKNYIKTLEIAEKTLSYIDNFAQEKGVNSQDFVSLFGVGLGIDVLREAYPGNDDYFEGIEKTLVSLKPYIESTPTPGEFLLAPDTPRPTSYVPDFVAALAAEVVTPDQLKYLGYNSDFIDNTQEYVDSLKVLIDYLDEGVEVDDITLLTKAGLTGAEAKNLTTAVQQADMSLVEGSGVVAWRGMTDEQKVEVAELYASYPAPKSDIVATVRSLAHAAAITKPLAGRIGMQLIASPFTAISTPFVKNITVGDLQKRLDNYAVKDAEGEILNYKLTEYIRDNPYDGQLLVSGGFDLEQVEEAQKGVKIKTMPQGATPLDWLISGAVVASFVLPAVRMGAWSLGLKLIQPVMHPGARLGTMALAQAAFRGAALGQEVLK